MNLSLDKGNSISKVWNLQINPNTKGDSLISGILCDAGLSKFKFCLEEKFKKNSFQFFLFLTSACVYLITQECRFIKLLQPNIVFVIFNTLNLSKLFLTPGD